MGDEAGVKCVLGGRVTKQPRPISKKTKLAVKMARKSVKTGEAEREAEERRSEQSRRTLYVRFKVAAKMPTELEEVKRLHPGIRHVRAPRQGTKKGKENKGKEDIRIRYAFVEFASEAEAEEAKPDIAGQCLDGCPVYVDYVGEKSAGGKKKKNPDSKSKAPINPSRLFVSGVHAGLTPIKLKKVFPKSVRALIPERSEKKGKTFGFVQFKDPADAKAAFDRSKDLKIDGNPVTVTFARMEIKMKRKSEENDEISPKKKRKEDKSGGAKTLGKEKPEQNISTIVEVGSDSEDDDEVENDADSGSEAEEEQEGDDVQVVGGESSDEDVPNDEGGDEESENEETSDAEVETVTLEEESSDDQGVEEEDNDDDDDDAESDEDEASPDEDD